MTELSHPIGVAPLTEKLEVTKQNSDFAPDCPDKK